MPISRIAGCAAAFGMPARRSGGRGSGPADQAARPSPFPVIPEAIALRELRQAECPGRGELPVDVALPRGSIWVLFPERLLQIGRDGDHVSVRMQLAPAGEVWAKLDVDPGGRNDLAGGRSGRV